MEEGANVAATDNHGWTALQLAVHFSAQREAEGKQASGNHDAVVRWLAGNGNDDGEATSHTIVVSNAKPYGGYSGTTGVTLRFSLPAHSPILINDLFSALYFGRAAAVVRLLLRKVVAARGNNEETALHIAVLGGHEAMVKLLLSTEKVDVNSKDKYNQTPLS